MKKIQNDYFVQRRHKSVMSELHTNHSKTGCWRGIALYLWEVPEDCSSSWMCRLCWWHHVCLHWWNTKPSKIHTTSLAGTAQITEVFWGLAWIQRLRRAHKYSSEKTDLVLPDIPEESSYDSDSELGSFPSIDPS